jgi:hypothetical protein
MTADKWPGLHQTTGGHPPWLRQKNFQHVIGFARGSCITSMKVEITPKMN